MNSFEEIILLSESRSRYLARQLAAQPRLRDSLLADLSLPFSREEMQAFLARLPVDDEASLFRALRQLRQAMMLRLICRDLGALADLHEVVRTATNLAEVAVNFSLSFLQKFMHARYGDPLAEDGQLQQLLVVGMGKLGGAELNVSSDIDLVFVYPHEGETSGPQKVSCEEYFTRLGRKLIASIGEITADGFVFRVDMRLRPYGDSGPLVSSFAALDAYFLTQGREWERYAWIKGRALTPGDQAGLDSIVQPFVYRKYLDFGAHGSMRDLHSQIRRQVALREMHDNIKLGAGGIREIEFIVQVFQLVRGGNERVLRGRSTLLLLAELAKMRLISPDAMRQLTEAYVFLRNLEHRLQYLDDQQTQVLPSNDEDRKIIAAAMGFAAYEDFLKNLDVHRRHVESHFGQVFASPQKDESDLVLVFSAENEKWAEERLGAMGFADCADMVHRLVALQQSLRFRQMSAAGQKNIEELVPELIKSAAKMPNPDDTLRRMLQLVESIGRRASYLTLLRESPQALSQLTRLSSASSWAAEYLCLHPVLLDELLDPRELYSPPDWAAIESELARRLADAAGDLEKQMDVLRQVQHATLFGLLAKDLMELLPLETVSDHLSLLADLILQQVLQLCWQDMRYRHCQGSPEFAIVGYGKLGGKELGYASDLDIIFLYDDPHPDAPEVYARLAKRISAMISSRTSAGHLYEIDLRLRPNGAAGLLVSSIQAFDQYQKNEAWVWEHQALTRARFVAGSRNVGNEFEKIRMEVLTRQRDPAALRAEIVNMRAKMLAGHPNSTQLFDLKHDRGGIVDVEFMVQFLVLAFSDRHPELTGNVGNLALLARAGEIGLIAEDHAARVRAAYRKFRKMQHSLRLQGEEYARIPREDIAAEVAAVLDLWNLIFPEN